MCITYQHSIYPSEMGEVFEPFVSHEESSSPGRFDNNPMSDLEEATEARWSSFLELWGFLQSWVTVGNQALLNPQDCWKYRQERAGTTPSEPFQKSINNFCIAGLSVRAFLVHSSRTMKSYAQEPIPDFNSCVLCH